VPRILLELEWRKKLTELLCKMKKKIEDKERVLVTFTMLNTPFFQSGQDHLSILETIQNMD
jgi:hypothetical protein